MVYTGINHNGYVFDPFKVEYLEKYVDYSLDIPEEQWAHHVERFDMCMYSVYTSLFVSMFWLCKPLTHTWDLLNLGLT